MPPVTVQELEALDPYVAGARPDERGELEIYCPMHNDSRRSASVNVEKGVWYCHAGCGGSSVRQLVQSEDAWVPADGRVHQMPPSAGTTSVVLPTMKEVYHWHKRLRRERTQRQLLNEKRGIGVDTIRKATLGYDGRHFKIPVFSPAHELWNIRNYDMYASNGRSKIWNTRGMGDARIYPVSIVDHRAQVGDAVLFCEGEWDTLLALQHGYLAVTRTDGAGKPWRDEWTPWFAGLRVFLCHDVDDTGARSDAEVAAALSDVAELYQCHLPFTAKGSDLSDYLLMFKLEKRTEMLGDLLASATKLEV